MSFGSALRRRVQDGLRVLTDAGAADALGELVAEGLAERDVALFEHAVEQL